MAEEKAVDERANAQPGEEPDRTRGKRFTGALTRLVLPLLNSVRRPYHLYPIGVLFGLGFDTASTITLLSVAAIAQRSRPDDDGQQGTSRGDGRVVMLAFLFTAGMTLVDSCDSAIMMVAYSRLGRDVDEIDSFAGSDAAKEREAKEEVEKKDVQSAREQGRADETAARTQPPPEDEPAPAPEAEPARPKLTTAAPAISFYLTLLSVLLAFAICLIEVLGIAAEQCGPCATAAAVEPASARSLGGRWWAFWAAASDQLGYIGAGIVGVFVLVTLAWWLARAVTRWRKGGRDPPLRALGRHLRQLKCWARGGLPMRHMGSSKRGFTLFGQSVLLIGGELLANAAIWAITAVVFVISHRRSDLALALLAWTTGLRHGLDADHISAIDNSIRRFLALEREDALSSTLQDVPVAELESQAANSTTRTKGAAHARWTRLVSALHAPILTGLFFSLGHSTIVFVATVIIAITTSALPGLQAFGDGPGGWVGTIVSASFLGLVGVLNSALLWRAWRARRRG